MLPHPRFVIIHEYFCPYIYILHKDSEVVRLALFTKLPPQIRANRTK